jgi:hypothetical protein
MVQGESLERRSGLQAIRAYSGRSRASLLVDRNGLGALKWLLLATQDREWPAWALEADAMD